MGELLGDQAATHNYYVHALKAKESLPIENLDQRDEVWQKKMQLFDNIALLTPSEDDNTKLIQVEVKAQQNHLKILVFL